MYKSINNSEYNILYMQYLISFRTGSETSSTCSLKFSGELNRLEVQPVAFSHRQGTHDNQCNLLEVGCNESLTWEVITLLDILDGWDGFGWLGMWLGAMLTGYPNKSP